MPRVTLRPAVSEVAPAPVVQRSEGIGATPDEAVANLLGRSAPSSRRMPTLTQEDLNAEASRRGVSPEAVLQLLHGRPQTVTPTPSVTPARRESSPLDNLISRLENRLDRGVNDTQTFIASTNALAEAVAARERNAMLDRQHAIQFDPANQRRGAEISLAGNLIAANYDPLEAARVAQQTSAILHGTPGQAAPVAGAATVPGAVAGSQLAGLPRQLGLASGMIVEGAGNRQQPTSPTQSIHQFIARLPHEALSTPQGLASTLEYLTAHNWNTGGPAPADFQTWWNTPAAGTDIDNATNEAARRTLSQAINRFAPGTASQQDSTMRNIVTGMSNMPIPGNPYLYTNNIISPSRGVVNPFTNSMAFQENPLDYLMPGWGRYRKPLDVRSVLTRLRGEPPLPQRR